MRQKPQSLDALRVKQLAEAERRLEEFLTSEEHRIAVTSFACVTPRTTQHARWHAQTILFEVCLKVSLRRSADIRTFLAADESEFRENGLEPKPASSGKNLVLSLFSGT
jgi:hypothetical protein